MSLFRLIARLDIKGDKVIKGIAFEGLRVVGEPAEMARRYAADADELLLIDTVASLYGRNHLEELLEKTTEEVFLPVTVGGGIRSVEDARRLFNAGADKVAINTAVLIEPDLINRLAERFGSQAVVVSIQAKKKNGGWEAYSEGGRQPSGRDAVAWAFEAVERGAGELLITSVDRDGTCRGCDVELIAKIAPEVPVPVVAGGGLGILAHLRDVVQNGHADAVACATALHFGKLSLSEMKQELLHHSVN